MVQEYNTYMGGVDRNDQLKSYYEIVVNSKKWWPRIFYDLVDRCVINAYILECESPNHTSRPPGSTDDWRLFKQEGGRPMFLGAAFKVYRETLPQLFTKQ